MRRAFPVIYARDVAGTVDFYERLLGFEKQYQFPPDGEPGYVGLRRDEADLGVVDESSPRQMIGVSVGDAPRGLRVSPSCASPRTCPGVSVLPSLLTRREIL